MIITQLRGGLGNQMFQYAFGKAAARRRQTKLVLDLIKLLYRNSDTKAMFRDYDLDVFTISPSITFLSKIEKSIPRRSRKISEVFVRANNLALCLRKKLQGMKVIQEQPNVFSMDILNSLPHNAYITGFWQNPSFLDEIADDLKKDFTFRDPLLPISIELMQQIQSTPSICLHVRRTDYIQEKKFIGLDFYTKAVEKMNALVPGARYFIFSDDIEWCKETLTFIPNAIFVEQEHAGRKNANHLRLMTACHHFIIPNSTFSWWAAWLSQNPTKKVVTLKNWSQGESYTINDIAPKDWIKV